MNYELGSDVVRGAYLSREMARSEKRRRSLLENVELAVIGTDPQGHVNYLNPFYKQLTGFDAEQMLRQSIQCLIGPLYSSREI